MSDLLEIWSLGDLRIERDQKPITGLASRKAEALVLYLADTARPHDREALATLLWHEYAADRALNNLSVLLTSLRKQLGAFLQISRNSIAINPDSNCWLDAQAFERQIEGAMERVEGQELLPATALEQLHRGLTLYQGDFLESFRVPHAQGFEEWALLRREQLKHLAIEALLTLATGYLRRGMYEQAVSKARGLLGMDPLDERTHRLIMLSLARLRRYNAAAKQYEACRQILADELGVEPSKETMALHERISAARATAQPQLPVGLTPFIGRQRDLSQIGEWLLSPSCRLLTVTGPGGIGKTRLAIEAARAVADKFLNGVFFIPLAQARSRSHLVAVMANVLGLRMLNKEEPISQLVDYLRQREMLLILDNFEHLLEAADVVRAILEGAEDVKLMITSRERLNVPAEWTIDLSGLPVPEEGATDEVEGYDSVRLFVNSARRVVPEFTLAPENKGAVAQICRLVEGMPLGIELACTWLRTLSVREMAVEIRRSLDVLQAADRGTLARHSSLQAVFDHSWNLLSPTERQAFARLSVFQGGFSREAAFQVAEVPLPILSALVDKSLVRSKPETDGESRFDMHDFTGQYALKKLAADPQQLEGMRRRHGDYYARRMRTLRKPVKGPDPVDSLETIGRELGNVGEAWRWAINSGRLSNLEDMIESLYRFFQVSSRFQEGEELFSEASRALGEQDGAPGGSRDVILGKLLGRQARFCLRIGQLERAVKLGQRSLTLLRGRAEEEIFARFTLSHAYHLLGDHPESQRLVQRGLEMARETGNRRAMGEGLLLNVRPLIMSGDKDAARETIGESTTIYRELGDAWLIGRCHHERGMVSMQIGDYQEAQSGYRESLSIFNKLGSHREAAACLHHLGITAKRQGELEKASQYYDRALAIFREVGDRRAIAASYHSLGEIAELQGDLAEAKRRYKLSLTISQEIKDMPRIALIKSCLGFIALAEERYRKSEELFREALELAHNTGVQVVILETLSGMAWLVAWNGQEELAAELVALILDHPATGENTRTDRAEPLRTRLATRLPPEVLTKAEARGKSQCLNDVVDRMLALVL